MNLAHTPLTTLKGVGDKLAAKLSRLGLASVQDLLLHLPLRYEDRTRIHPIGELLPGLHTSVEGEIHKVEVVQGKRRMLTCRISDGSGSLTLRFFNFTSAQQQSLAEGRRIKCFGEIRSGRFHYEMIHPEYRLLDEHDAVPLEQSLTPVYPATEGLKQISLRNLTGQALALLAQHPLPELLPAGMTPGGLSVNDALLLLHRPPPDVAISQLEQGSHPARQRLAIEELLAQHLSMLLLRGEHRQDRALALAADHRLSEQLLASLPFQPTAAQQRVVADIRCDLARPHPMMRLVQGDVGSGKTLVAALAALEAIAAGAQVALMAPTELLAEQHALSFREWFAPLGLEVGWLTGKLKGKARDQLLSRAAAGELHLLVGTHALFQEEVRFQRLALVIIDEQHRFGVHQRLALREKGVVAGIQPHQLIMTATPIPRTLAMTAYADLDTSIIDELPPGRTPVTTVAVPDNRRDEVIARVRQVCREENRQAYWVCTLIEESEALQCQAAEDTAAQLAELLPELNIGLVHGRMKSAAKQQVMDTFKEAELDLLVATTVIEVGVNVPNASLMIIENPERLGLAQLHQLRGRVGRGAIASHCVLLYHSPLSKTAAARLGVLRETNDGFRIAQRDLEIRGPGELLGTRQTGLADLRIADLVRDQHLLPRVQQLAGRLYRDYPQQARAVVARWLGQRDHYSQA